MEDDNAKILVMELAENIETLIADLPPKYQIDLLNGLKQAMKDDPADTDDFFLIRTLELMVDNRILQIMVEDLQRKLASPVIKINMN